MTAAKLLDYPPGMSSTRHSACSEQKPEHSVVRNCRFRGNPITDTRSCAWWTVDLVDELDVVDVDCVDSIQAATSTESTQTPHGLPSTEVEVHKGTTVRFLLLPCPGRLLRISMRPE